MHDGTLLAALDLGSNSFRLEIGRLHHGQIQRIEYLKETVRQGSGLDENGMLSPAAMQRGWDCLARFGERLRGFAPHQVRAVATQTLRVARNREVFLAKGLEVLGFPIDVVSGPEEARLIYAGVARMLPPSDERRLVVDIGGRSTELILGRGLRSHVVGSYPLGSVAWSMAYFPEGRFTVQAFDAAHAATEDLLADTPGRYPRESWDVAYGSSGTVGAIGDLLAGLGEPKGLITRKSLVDLRARLLQAQSADKLKLDGLKEDRRPVIGGGVAVLGAVFDLLGIEQMQVAQGALRQGVLYDLVQREAPATDIRTATVQALSARFGTDAPQAARVGRTVRALFDQVLPRAEPEAAHLLDRAAQLHEIGTSIAHADHPRHGAYILHHTDAPGFSLQELRRLAELLLGQRGKLRKLSLDLEDARFVMQLLCLRLAILLCHARRDPVPPLPRLSPVDRGFQLRIGAAWAASFPQSAHLLRAEAEAWKKTPWDVNVLLG